MIRASYEYNGKYIREVNDGVYVFKWVYVPKYKVHFLHYNTLSSDNITMGVFVEDGVVYLMAYVFEEGNYFKCALSNIKKSTYNNVNEAETDKKVNNSGFHYYEMDSIYYCEWCTKDR